MITYLTRLPQLGALATIVGLPEPQGAFAKAEHGTETVLLPLRAQVHHNLLHSRTWAADHTGWVCSCGRQPAAAMLDTAEVSEVTST